MIFPSLFYFGPYIIIYDKECLVKAKIFSVTKTYRDVPRCTVNFLRESDRKLSSMGREYLLLLKEESSIFLSLKTFAVHLGTPLIYPLFS